MEKNDWLLDITNIKLQSQIISKTRDTTKEIKNINFFNKAFYFLI